MWTASASGLRTRAWTLGCALALAAALPGCGSSGSGAPAAAAEAAAGRAGPSIPANCPDAVLAAVEYVARRVYTELARGRIVASVVRRLESSASLSSAVARDDPLAARRALGELLAHQVAAVRVVRGARTLAAIEAGAGIAPARGLLVDAHHAPVGSFTVSMQGISGYAATIAALVPGARVVVTGGGVLRAVTFHPVPALLAALAAGRREAAVGGVAYRVQRLSGTAFSGGLLTISVLFPSSSVASLCRPRPPSGLSAPSASSGSSAGTAPSAVEAWAATLGSVAEQVYRSERVGAKAELILSDIERSSPFREAVLAGDRAATRAAIIGFFRTSLHIVRVRVIRAGRLLIDVGGPHVLAPISGVVRDASGRVAARFLFAIQDDLGFQLLSQAFTGAQVLMREGALQVMGTLHPGPAAVPDRGSLVYRGVPYEAYSFDAEAFPSGPLRISLLFPTG
jgi:hypothetical protein